LTTVSFSFDAMLSAVSWSRYSRVVTPPAVVMTTFASPKSLLMGPLDTWTWWILSMGTRVWETVMMPRLISTLSSSIL
jgi:hypothetical protein